MSIDRATRPQAVFGGLERAEYDQLTRELTGYCYRMLGSPFDAEDAVQETMMRAWRELERFEGRSSLRTWVYRIATNVCIDSLRKRGRRTLPMSIQPPSPPDVSHIGQPVDESNWVLPVPDEWTGQDNSDPAQRVVARESVRLAFVAALQRLTPRQRAVLILRDVLQFSAAESAELLGTTVASANSALQRARVAVPATTEAGKDTGTSSGSSGITPSAGTEWAAADQALLEEYVSAFEAYDVPRLTSLLRSDAVQQMPPLALWIRGADTIGEFMVGPGAECRGSRLLATAANGCAAFAQYRRDGSGGHSPWALQVLETHQGKISVMHTFLMPRLFELFGFPPAL